MSKFYFKENEGQKNHIAVQQVWLRDYQAEHEEQGRKLRDNQRKHEEEQRNIRAKFNPSCNNKM